MSASRADAAAGGKRFRSLDDPETLLLIAQNLEEGIYITTASGEILDANPAFLRMFGVSSISELSRFRAGDLIADPNATEIEARAVVRERSLEGSPLRLLDSFEPEPSGALGELPKKFGDGFGSIQYPPDCSRQVF